MTIIAVDKETTGVAFTFSSINQALIVKSGTVLASSASQAIVGGSDLNSDLVTNFGTVFGVNGIVLNGQYDEIYNENGGVIASNNTAITTTGPAAFVSNDGTISGYAALQSSGRNFSLVNNGTITAATGAIELAAQNQTITNTGLIEGTTCGIQIDGSSSAIISNYGQLHGGSTAVVDLSFGAVVLKNIGSIDGKVALGGGADKLFNAGTITGDVSFGNGADLLLNTGSIAGDVSLGNGGSSFNGKGGTVTGTITGGTGADRIAAGNDGESMAGGAGHDTLFGGNGQDTFVFSSAQAADTDVVHWFKVADDTIQLDHNAFAALTPGTSPIFAIGSAATTASDHLFYNSATGVLSYDVDGSGATNAAQPIATLDTGLALTTHNFTVV